MKAYLTIIINVIQNSKKHLKIPEHYTIYVRTIRDKITLLYFTKIVPYIKRKKIPYVNSKFD